MEIKVGLHIAYVIYLGLGIGLLVVSCGCGRDLNGLTIAMRHHISQITLFTYASLLAYGDKNIEDITYGDKSWITYCICNPGQTGYANS